MTTNPASSSKTKVAPQSHSMAEMVEMMRRKHRVPPTTDIKVPVVKTPPSLQPIDLEKDSLPLHRNIGSSVQSPVEYFVKFPRDYPVLRLIASRRPFLNWRSYCFQVLGNAW